MDSSNTNLIEKHYEACWNTTSAIATWNLGPVNQLPHDFKVLVFKPRPNRKMWTYATCGMSQQGDAPPLELHMFSPIHAQAHVELLALIAHFHLTGAYLDVSHTVNYGRPWLPQSKCDHGLISLPYLDGPKLEWLALPERRIHFLWLVPITADEVHFKRTHGLEALENRFEERQFNYLDPVRASVV